ncbi:hypothetical protein [Bradyrhizobium septentrionale]|uniref:Uncharacterized protein n=1 Tax=Bradyrhizobium septentrionale TaxID=1404411 RepID=A0A974A3H8_9BRAD|nr:hypothetical protein [Bradyrhizobium septentrionale]UGY15453.1 hypothetical protein HAP48_0044190 [Bradyrhizobium septentrionale]UGY24034.1 hypothetical protein HU675_0039860 [Bradyrhizobium septentrionale]
MSKQRSAIRGLVFAATVTAAVPAMATAGDLRDINVGMAISSVPDAGYINLTCAGEKTTHRLAEWAQWSNCPAGPDQLRGIRFEYDSETAREGTMVAGHPAILTVMIDQDAKIAALTIETDPKARLYLRKKAFLLGLQARSRYGEDGWSCSNAQPAGGKQEVGGVFVDETCSKTTDGRTVVIERHLYREPNKELKDMTDETRITIRRAGS